MATATKKIGIIGLGLMGGSLSIALKQTPNEFHFIGLDHNKEHCTQALALGLVDEITERLEEITRCDIIFLTIPVDGIIAVSKQIGSLDPKCTVIDLGSTKEKISNAIPKEIRENFVTAHPMTGTEKFGPTAAIDNLYQNKVMVVCDQEMSGELQKDIAIGLFQDIEARVEFMDADEHDKHAAFISHLPHALSYALANTVMKQEDPKSILILAAGGFKDMSRIAKSSPAMWSNIFRQNRDNILKSIDILQQELQLQKTMIENEEWDKLSQWMKEATTLHNIL
jgi:prephenate dehydrogenase